MATLALLLTQVKRLEKSLLPKPAKDTRLPWLVETDEGDDYPGYAEHNREHERISRILGLPAKIYVGFDPDEDGIES